MQQEASEIGVLKKCQLTLCKNMPSDARNLHFASDGAMLSPQREALHLFSGLFMDFDVSK